MTPREAIADLVDVFEELSDWEDRYAHIISMGRSLPQYPEAFRSETYKVRGCQSQVWLYPELRGDRIHFSADSDAVIVKGLIALLMYVYNDRTPAETLATPADFLSDLGLDQHLSKSRSNGLYSMVRQIRRYADLAAVETPHA